MSCWRDKIQLKFWNSANCCKQSNGIKSNRSEGAGRKASRQEQHLYMRLVVCFARNGAKSDDSFTSYVSTYPNGLCHVIIIKWISILIDNSCTNTISKQKGTFSSLNMRYGFIHHFLIYGWMSVCRALLFVNLKWFNLKNQCLSRVEYRFKRKPTIKWYTLFY